MATLNFPDAPDTGDIYTDSNSGFTYEWNGTVWISKDPSTASNIREIDNISSGFNGSTTAFTLQVAGVNVEPANVQQLIISVGGVMQNAGDDYTVSGSTLTFTTAPTAGLTFFGTLLGTALSLNTVADGSVSPASLTTTSNYIVGGLTADQNAGFVTAYGLVAGAGGVNVSGAVTGGSFSGDGSGLTGVASTDNIITSYGATFLSNVRVAGIFTAANAYVTGILTAQTLNYNNVTDIYSTGIITATGGIQQTGNEGLHVSAGISTVGIFTATKATVGLAVTINNTGVDAGIGAGIITAKDYYGNASNMTGIGMTVDVIGSDPLQGSAVLSAANPETITFNINQGIKAGNADKNIDLRSDSLTGSISESFGVGSSVTYSFGQAIIQPSGIGLTNETTYFAVAPDGAFEAVGGGNSSGIVNSYSFDTKPYDRRFWVCGNNNNGNFGSNGSAIAVAQAVSSPVQTGGSSAGWKELCFNGDAASAAGVFGLKTDNTLWAWGYNGNSMLGLGDGTYRSSPTQIGSDKTWKSVTSSYRASAAIKTDGTLWSWGFNQWGELGHNDRTGYSSPKQVGTETTWSIIAGNGNSQNRYFGAVKTDGTLWSWGYSVKGGTGQSDLTKYSSPTQIGTATDWVSITLNPLGSVYATKNATAAPGRFLDKQGELWAWGKGDSGELMQNNKTEYSSPRQVPGTTWDAVRPNCMWGSYRAFLTKSNGTLWCCGDGQDGNLGLNQEDRRASSPVQMGTKTNWASNRTASAFNQHGALNEDGELFVWGRNNYGKMMVTNGQAVVGGLLSSPTLIGGGNNFRVYQTNYFTSAMISRTPS